MNIIITAVVLGYALLLLLTSIVSNKNVEIPKIYRFSLALASLLLGIFVCVSNLYLLGGDFFLISVITWFISPYISEQRHLSHHVIRFVAHFILLILLVFFHK